MYNYRGLMMTEAEYISRCKAANKAFNTKRFNEIADMVIELVHPANLGELPPSPFMIKAKAVELGLCDWSYFDRLPLF